MIMDYKDLLRPNPKWKDIPTSTPPGIIPGGRYGQDMGAQIADAYRKGGVGGAVGMAARTAVGAPLAVAADIGRPYAELGMQGLDAFGNAIKSGARSLLTGRSGPPSEATSGLPTMPAVTQNAVANATGTAATEDRGFDPNATQSVQVPKGPVSSPQDRAEGYPGRTMQGNSVSLAGGGLPGITFNSPPAAVAQAAQGVSPNVGLLPPEFHGQIAELLDAAKPLINSKGIVDRLRGRQLLGARDRLIQGAATIAGSAIAGANANTNAYGAQAQMLGAQTGAYRASNEVPLAMLQSATQKYGYDSSANTSLQNAALAADTSRYHTDTTNATANRAVDMRTALDVPRAQRDQMVNDALQAGNEGYAGTVATIDRREPAAKISAWVSDGMGRMVRSRADGKTETLVTDPKTQMTKIVVVDPDKEDEVMKGIVKNAVNR